jgi:hypothetical protein
MALDVNGQWKLTTDERSHLYELRRDFRDNARESPRLYAIAFCGASRDDIPWQLIADAPYPDKPPIPMDNLQFYNEIGHDGLAGQRACFALFGDGIDAEQVSRFVNPAIHTLATLRSSQHPDFSEHGDDWHVGLRWLKLLFGEGSLPSGLRSDTLVACQRDDGSIGLEDAHLRLDPLPETQPFPHTAIVTPGADVCSASADMLEWLLRQAPQWHSEDRPAVTPGTVGNAAAFQANAARFRKFASGFKALASSFRAPNSSQNGFQHHPAKTDAAFHLFEQCVEAGQVLHSLARRGAFNDDPVFKAIMKHWDQWISCAADAGETGVTGEALAAYAGFVRLCRRWLPLVHPIHDPHLEAGDPQGLEQCPDAPWVRRWTGGGYIPAIADLAPAEQDAETNRAIWERYARECICFELSCKALAHLLDPAASPEELGTLGARGKAAESEPSQSGPLKVDIERRQVIFDGQTYTLRSERAIQVLAKMAEQPRAFVPCPSGNRWRELIPRMPKPIQPLIERQPGQGGGARLNL